MATQRSGLGSPPPRAGATINIQSSIFEDTRGSSGPGNTGWCLMMDDDTAMVAGYSFVGLDPKFADPDNGDLHLTVNSAAIDLCFSDNFAPTDLDIDLEARGFDLPGNINGIGSYDFGFDEYTGAPPPNTIIFSDGFESGDTSAWS